MCICCDTAMDLQKLCHKKKYMSQSEKSSNEGRVSSLHEHRFCRENAHYRLDFSTLFTFSAELLEICSLWGTLWENILSVSVTILTWGQILGPFLHLETSELQSGWGLIQAQRLRQWLSQRPLRNKILHSCVAPVPRPGAEHTSHNLVYESSRGPQGRHTVHS